MNTGRYKTIKKDVIVIGGGTSGVFAAISASDAGADTLLVEKNGMLGGTMTVSGVNYPGLFYAWGKRILGGHAWEVINEIMRNGLSEYPEIKERRDVHWLEQFRLNVFSAARAFDRNCQKFGVDVLLHTMAAGVDEKSGGISVLLCGKEGLFRAEAKCLVDATGDACAVRMAGYGVIRDNEVQPASLVCTLDGCDNAKTDPEDIADKYRQAEERNSLPSCLTLKTFKEKLLSGRGDIHIECPPDVDTSAGRTAVEQRAREEVEKYLELVRSVKGCENAVIRLDGFECGIRESVRIDGKYTVTADDYVSGTRFDDAVCFAFYPVDLHVRDGVAPVALRDGVIPTVPLRALIPKGSRSIVAVGRCLSSDRIANSGLRVQVPCMATGQAGGIAAALAAKSGSAVGDVPFEMIKEELCRQGCIVP